MRTKARLPKIARARGNSAVPVGKPVDARTTQTFEAGVAERQEKAASLAEERDLSWLIEGALAYMKVDMVVGPAPNKGDMETLQECNYGEPRYTKGTPVVFSQAKRLTVINHRRGPMRIVRHEWITPGGGKYCIPLDKLQRDSDL